MPPDFLDIFEKVPGGSQTSGRRRKEVDAQLLGHGPRWICHKNKVRGIRSLLLPPKLQRRGLVFLGKWVTTVRL